MRREGLLDCALLLVHGLPPQRFRSLFNARANRAGLKSLVDSRNPPGLIGYRGKAPVGWISLAPREEFARLRRSPVMKPVDDKPVWSIVCYVVPPEHRGQGVAHVRLNLPRKERAGA